MAAPERLRNQVSGTKHYFFQKNTHIDIFFVAKKNIQIIIIIRDVATTERGFQPQSPACFIIFVLPE